MDTKSLVGEFLELQKAYAHTTRALVTSERYKHIALAGLIEKGDLGNEVLRESLLEHVGHLPVLATFLYPHIEHSSEVHIGHTLAMLAVHDIGETKTGDIFAYHKTTGDEEHEMRVAREVLNPTLHHLLDEYDAGETPDARYARSIDALAPNIREVDMPRVTMKRFKSLGATVDDVIEKKRKLHEWDTVLLEIFDTCMTQYRCVETGDPFVLPVKECDVV